MPLTNVLASTVCWAAADVTVVAFHAVFDCIFHPNSYLACPAETPALYLHLNVTGPEFCTTSPSGYRMVGLNGVAFSWFMTIYGACPSSIVATWAT